MSRRMLALAAGGALAIGVVIAGAIIAIGQDSGSFTTPTGDRNELRLEAINAEVSCGTVAAVRLYLDDLVFHESPRDAGVPLGMIGFELPVQYDPNVVRILNANDVQLNQNLGQQDVDGDGVIREFITLAALDSDYLGRAVIGAASIVPSSQSPEDNFEEGVDPVTKGEPLLLMTVRFTPVGEGDANIRLEGWERPSTSAGPIGLTMFDTDRVLYEQIVSQDARITVRGGDCPGAPPTPTVRATPTPFVVPTQTPVRWETVEPVDAPSAGRADCPQDWVVYTDPQDRFSICYPGDFEATASDFALNVGTGPLHEREEAYSMSMAVSWNATPGTIYHPPSVENCSNELVLGRTLSTGLLDIAIGDGSVPACFTQGNQEGGSTANFGNLRTAVPLARDGSDGKGYVQVSIGFSGAGIDQIPDLVRMIVQTLLVSRS